MASSLSSPFEIKCSHPVQPSPSFDSLFFEYLSTVRDKKFPRKSLSLSLRRGIPPYTRPRHIRPCSVNGENFYNLGRSREKVERRLKWRNIRRISHLAPTYINPLDPLFNCLSLSLSRHYPRASCPFSFDRLRPTCAHRWSRELEHVRFLAVKRGEGACVRHRCRNNPERASFSPVCTLALKFPSRSPPSLPLASSRGKYARMVVQMGGEGKIGGKEETEIEGVVESNGQRVRGCSR